MYPPGTILEKQLFIFRHVGVCLGNGYVLQNTPFKGEEVVSESDFIYGAKFKVRDPGRIDVSSFLSRVSEIELNPRSYNLISNNCEHTIYRALYGSARSPQLMAFSTVALCLAAVMITRRARA